MSKKRVTPEQFYGLLCDYVRADGWQQDDEGLWSRDHDGYQLTLTGAVKVTMEYDGLVLTAPAPPVETKFGPT
jgi:hypothetical protein